MEPREDSRRGKHLTREERMVIERMSRGGRPPRDWGCPGLTDTVNEVG